MSKDFLARTAATLDADPGMRRAIAEAPAQGARGEWNEASRALRARAIGAMLRAAGAAIRGLWSRPAATATGRRPGAASV